MKKSNIKPANQTIKPERIQKVLANFGIGSRRDIEQWIREGRITVDDQVATLGQSITSKNRIKFDGRPLNLIWLNKPITRVLLYHKPVGEACTTRDPLGRPTVFDKLPSLRNKRWVMVGRLDINTSGLLLFTTNGELANCLMHPSYQVEREYAVRVIGEIDPVVMKKLLAGVIIDDELFKFDSIVDAGGRGVNHWYHVVLHEGKYREIRRVFEELGFKVSRLIRVRYGEILLPRYLSRGKYKEMSPEEVEVLKNSVGF